jgi:hypothetical protein
MEKMAVFVISPAGSPGSRSLDRLTTIWFPLHSCALKARTNFRRARPICTKFSDAPASRGPELEPVSGCNNRSREYSRLSLSIICSRRQRLCEDLMPACPGRSIAEGERSEVKLAAESIQGVRSFSTKLYVSVNRLFQIPSRRKTKSHVHDQQCNNLSFAKKLNWGVRGLFQSPLGRKTRNYRRTRE